MVDILVQNLSQMVLVHTWLMINGACVVWQYPAATALLPPLLSKQGPCLCWAGNLFPWEGIVSLNHQEEGGQVGTSCS